MKYSIVLATVFLSAALPAAAQTHLGCNKDQTRVVEEAIRNAKELTLNAAAAVGDTPEYDRWFGDYSEANAEEVRATLKAVVSAIRGGGVTTQCHTAMEDGCNAGEYAWVYADEAYLLHLCPPFFNLPPLTALEPGTRRSNNGTREGTIVHELSHFLRVANTDDHCYSRRDCSDMATYDERRAIENADSYQYYTEDVTYYARQPISGKPPAADRGE